MELAPIDTTMSVESLRNVPSVREIVENCSGKFCKHAQFESESRRAHSLSLVCMLCGFVALIEIKQRFIRIFCV